MPETILLNNLQHVNLKLFALGTVAEDVLDQAIPVFHRWIQACALPELLVDVADYRHVPEGPGVILIGHEANYSLDCAGGRLGLLYNRKSSWEGSFEERLRLAYEQALNAARRLEAEPEFSGRIAFDARRCEVVMNDRLLAPNTSETWAALQPALQAFFRSAWGEPPVQLEWASADPRERFRVEARIPLTQ